MSVAPQISAVEALGAAIDCSNVEINYTDNPQWSKNERIEEMDKAFFESVNRFELCNLSNQSNGSGSANGLAQAANTGSGDGGGDGPGVDSTANSTMKGTEKKPESETKSEKANDSDLSDNTSNEAPENTENNQGYRPNGAKPENIPSADNDDVIAAQIRLAAEIEQDPVKKKKLWNEYRKYKGMPTQ